MDASQHLDKFDETLIKKTVLHRLNTWNFEDRFPGAQPISFSHDNLKTIQMNKTLVCEKTDGMRFLLLEVLIGQQNVMTFLIDRQYNFRMVSHLYHSTPVPYLIPNSRTGFMIVNFWDGELVIDRAWRKNSSAPIFLVFDALITNTQNLISSPFHRRLIETHKYV